MFRIVCTLRNGNRRDESRGGGRRRWPAGQTQRRGIARVGEEFRSWRKRIRRKNVLKEDQQGSKCAIFQLTMKRHSIFSKDNTSIVLIKEDRKKKTNNTTLIYCETALAIREITPAFPPRNTTNAVVCWDHALTLIVLSWHFKPRMERIGI